MYWSIYRITGWLCENHYNTLARVIITGNRCFTVEDYIHDLVIQIKKSESNILKKQDINVIQNRIQQFSWVQRVSIRRIWPNILKINIVDCIPIAYWNTNFLISKNGVVFHVPQHLINNYDDVANMPYLYGPAGTEQCIIEKYLIFNEILKSVKFQVSSLKMDTCGSWELFLQNGILLRLGKKKILGRLCVFIKNYPMLLEKMNEQKWYIDYIDLRYKSGFAVKWIYDPITTHALYH